MEPTIVGGPNYQSYFVYTLAVERLDEVNLSSARVDSEMVTSTRDRVGDFVVIAVRGRHLPQTDATPLHERTKCLHASTINKMYHELLCVESSLFCCSLLCNCKQLHIETYTRSFGKTSKPCVSRL